MTLTGFIDCRLGIQLDVLHCSAKISQIFRQKNPRFSAVLHKQPHLTDQSVHASLQAGKCVTLGGMHIFYIHCCVNGYFPQVPWHCWLGGMEGCENWMLVCWWWWCHWSFARLRVLISTYTTCHHLLLQQNPGCFGILVPVFPDCPGILAIKQWWHHMWINDWKICSCARLDWEVSYILLHEVTEQLSNWVFVVMAGFRSWRIGEQ